jgi:SAM-dependent methyltransferase
MSTDEFWKYFFEMFEAIPRQGPGDRESTERALGLLPQLSADQRILDIGCGSGVQTTDLAQLTAARVVAVDKHRPFVSQLARRAGELGLGERIDAQVGDMNDLQFPDGSFDVIWSEGAIFIIGFAQGLSAWRRLLVPGGHLVVSEFCWFRDDPPAELVEMLRGECSDVGNVDARREAVAKSGYRLLSDFVLPDEGWWENFYVPLGECVERFREQHSGNDAALEVADSLKHEIDLYVKHPGAYGYVFFVMQRDETG